MKNLLSVASLLIAAAVLPVIIWAGSIARDGDYVPMAEITAFLLWLIWLELIAVRSRA